MEPQLDIAPQQNLGTLIKKNTIPLHLQLNKIFRKEKYSNSNKNKSEKSNEILGLINFPTQDYKMKMLGQVEINSQIHKQTISYKAVNTQAQEGENKVKQPVSKRFIQYNKITIRPKKLNKKYFTVNVPIKSSKPGNIKNHNQNHHFVLQFSNKQGRLSLVNEFHQANMQILNTNKKKVRTTQQIIELQKQMLDNRRKDPDFKNQSQQEQQRPKLDYQ